MSGTFGVKSMRIYSNRDVVRGSMGYEANGGVSECCLGKGVWTVLIVKCLLLILCTLDGPGDRCKTFHVSVIFYYQWCLL